MCVARVLEVDPPVGERACSLSRGDDVWSKARSVGTPLREFDARAREPGASERDLVVKDAAWSYAFTTAAMAPIAGLVAFLNERLDITVDGRRLERPVTPFS
jgi:hypothetical protein